MQEAQDKPEMSQDVKQELQAELIRLQRQYRYLEDDRSAYKEEAEYQLKKQNGIIQGLETEEEELQKVFNLARSRRNVLLDLVNLKKLRELLDEEKFVEDRLQGEKDSCNDLDQRINKMRQVIDKKRKDIGGCHMSEQQNKLTEKHIRVLGNRLDKMKVKFNMALAENGMYRQEIDHIAAQRTLFFDIHKKLRKIYEQAQSEKDRLIEFSTALFHTREEAEHRMQSLKERSERDLTQYNAELKDLLRIIDHDRHLREFMNTKAEERAEQFEKLIQVRVEKKMSTHVKALKVEVDRYEEIFGRLAEVSGLKDVADVVNKFVNTEDQNFALFNFVNDQNVQRQQLEEDILNLKDEKRSIEKGDVAMGKERKVILREIQERLEKTTSNAEMFVKMHKADKKLFEKLRTQVGEMFSSVGCEWDALTDVLGDSEITNENLLRFLGVIEQRCNELLQAKLVLACREGNEHDIILLQNILIGILTKDARQFYRAPSVVLDQDQIVGTNVPNKAQELPASEEDTRTSAVLGLGKLTKKYAVDSNEAASKRKGDKKKKEH